MYSLTVRQKLLHSSAKQEGGVAHPEMQSLQCALPKRELLSRLPRAYSSHNHRSLSILLAAFSIFDGIKRWDNRMQRASARGFCGINVGGNSHSVPFSTYGMLRERRCVIIRQFYLCEKVFDFVGASHQRPLP